MIVCIAHAKVGYRQAIHRNPGLERVPGFFVDGRNTELSSSDFRAREVDRGSNDDGDAAGRSKLAAYMLRAPMSLEKMIYDADTGTVIYRSKMPASAAEATGGRGSWPRSRRR